VCKAKFYFHARYAAASCVLTLQSLQSLYRNMWHLEALFRSLSWDSLQENTHTHIQSDLVFFICFKYSSCVTFWQLRSVPYHFKMCTQVTEAHLPSEASIELPKVHVSAEYVQDGNSTREAQFAGMEHQQCLLYFSWSNCDALLGHV
jgi:hypothetical protein